jgi:hypothetical protein
LTVEVINAFVDVFLNSIVLVEIVAGSIFSLRVTVTAVLTATPVAPLVGETDTTVGGVVSDPALVLNITSTQ